MSFVVATLKKDLARFRQDAPSIALWMLIPLLIGGLITLMVDQDSGGGPSGTLLIADQDESFVSGAIAGAFGQGQLADMLAVQNVSEVEGTALIEAGKASGMLVIPTGFQAALFDSEPVALTLKTNPSQTVLPSIIEDVTEILLDIGFYLNALFADEIAAIANTEGPDAPADAFVSDLAVHINGKMETLGPVMFPPLLEVEIKQPPPSEPQPDFALLFLPGVVLMALLFAAQGMSSDFWKERELGTLRRLVSTPGRLLQFVAGKTLAAVIMLALVAAVTLSLGFLYHDLDWRGLFPSLLWVSVGGVGFFAWFAGLQMLFPNSKAANLITSIIVFPLLMMGGSFFPLDVLPDWLAAVGRLSPNGFVVDRLTTELTSASHWTFSTRSWLTVLAILASGMLLIAWRLRSGFARR